jgi:hypothetical protein
MKPYGRLLLPLSLLLAAVSNVWAANPTQLEPKDVNIGELVKEVTWQRIDASGIQLVFWIPQEYWTAFLSQQGHPSDDSAELLDLLSGHAMFAVVKGIPGKDDVYEDADTIRASMRMIDPTGTNHVPLADVALPPKLAGILGYLKPVLAGSMGALGKGMNFIVFPAKDASGRSLVDATAEGRLRITLAGQEHAYRLPLGTLLEPMHDVQTGETFPGNYDFNPYTGTRLQATKP